jgi:hypothetical protein
MAGAPGYTGIADAERAWQAPLSAPVALMWSLRDALQAERDRWFLWLPACLGTGIGIYFSLRVEPPLWLGLMLALLAVAVVAVARLVAFYETFRDQIGGWYRDAGWVRRWGIHVLGIVFTTVVSTVATTPFTVLRFNQAT